MAKEIRNCACCGLPFEALNKQQMYCHRPHYLPCPICGKPVLKTDRDFTRPPACCSKECTVEKNRKNLPIKKCIICGEEFKPKSGIAQICERDHYINCEICGKQILLTKKMWHDKITTCSRECAKEKMRKFYQAKYGVDHPMQSSTVQEHFKAAMKAKYGVEHALQKKEFLEHAYQTNLDRFGTLYACLRDECRSVSPMPLISSHNKKWGKLLENNGINIEYEKKIGNRSFDICIEDQKTVLEINPTYTHNSLYNHWNSPIKPDYHKLKSDIAENNGYRCIQVFEWDTMDKILEMLKPNKTRIGARKCTLKEVSIELTNEFLKKYHIQGTVRKQEFRYGLFLNDELIQIMTFGQSRYNKKYDIELLRLCTKWGYIVIGGSERLFKYAVESNPTWDTVVSYCDRAKFRGYVYYRMGMSLVQTTPPQVVWSKGTDKVTSMLLRQRGYDQLFKTNYGKGTSNEQLMIENGWLPVYDCGQYVFLYNRRNA